VTLPKNPLTTPVQANLLRLLRWHGLDNRGAARLLGSTPHTVGDWLSGKREPGADYLLLVGELFNVNPRDLHRDPREFGAVVADPDRLTELDAQAWRERGYVLDEFGLAWALAVRAA